MNFNGSVEARDDLAAAEAARKVAPIFKANGWTWLDEKEPPSEGRLAIHIRDMIRDIRADDKTRAIFCGRLGVENEDSEGCYPEKPLRISLVLGHAYPDFAA